MTAETGKLRLGSATVQRLLPQRRPMLFVDFVAAYERAPRPALRAGFHISANDHTFEGHFPQLPIWPGVYTIEGLNQACNLLASISSLQKHWQDAGGEPAEVLEALRETDRAYQLKGAPHSASSTRLQEVMQGSAGRVGLSAGVDIRFTAPVFAGCRLDYSVVQTHADDTLLRYEVEALVDGSPVARGKLILSPGRQMPSLAAP